MVASTTVGNNVTRVDVYFVAFGTIIGPKAAKAYQPPQSLVQHTEKTSTSHRHRWHTP